MLRSPTSTARPTPQDPCRQRHQADHQRYWHQGKRYEIGHGPEIKEEGRVIARASKRSCQSRGALRVEDAEGVDGLIRKASQTQATASANAMKYARGGCM